MATKKKAKKVTLEFTRTEAKRLWDFINETPLRACKNDDLVATEEAASDSGGESIDWSLYRRLTKALGIEE